uniref:Paxillin, isoform F n=2 Tax=Drosophila melanogaster TaxID=7227 RepID=Q2PDT4_DROME|nr:paxillin, isoform G [Drosophila melanogaster]NP_724184.2 paxillin, isoform F [Drosophila melanogaster]AAN11038.2 paxillin, isoform F [Drosophila melanogaster]AAN11040.2 paxillin, isoform G [Drosophila melanogaster]|eukprot:NP_001033913.1 paxillin, isoform G [Drosophila melanogaster]
MDRTMYGKIDPGARQPYRTARSKGILPGYALLADLQNSVPGQPQQPQPQYGTVQPKHQALQQQQFVDNTPGYGSLRGKAQPQVYQEHYSVETRSPTAGHDFNGSSTTPGYANQGSLPRQAAGASTGLSELDSLLQDLQKIDVPVNYSTPVSKYNTMNSYATVEERPSVDSLLKELDNAHIYAVPNGSAHKSPTPGRHVTITVRETKTEKLTGPDGPVGTVEEQIVQQKDSYTPNHAVPGQQVHQAYTSQATKELDDLMASLSDFKVSNGTNGIGNGSHPQQHSSTVQHQTVTDYARPNKGSQQAHLTQTIEETTIVEDSREDQLDSMLGNLQANMSRQGVNTVQKGCCNACEKPIVGQVITALGKTWHPEHFTCNHCSQELGTRNFFERDGFPYCEPDYHNLFSPRCAYCNGAILDKCVTALDKTWHTEHFFCAQCGQQFGEEGFHERDGKPYCRNDYFEMFAPKCNGCNRAIMENYISALNSQWHPDCFVCRDCRQPFQGGSFFDHEGLPYCETHYHAKRGSLCAGCSKPITGRCITAMFKKFHPEHFVCAFCLKQLNKGTFKEQKDKPYCHTCFDKIFG